MICCRGEGCGGPAARIPWESNIRRVSAIWLEKLEQLMISYNLPIIIATKYSKPLPTKPTEKVACHFPKMPQYMLFLKEKSTNHQFNGFPPPRCASAADFRSLRFVVLGGESGFFQMKTDNFNSFSVLPCFLQGNHANFWVLHRGSNCHGQFSA